MWRRGERAVARYLRWRGWRVLARNHRVGHDELDVIAVHPTKRVLAIVEVKSTATKQRCIDRVGYAKQCRIARASARLPQRWRAGRAMRFDVAEVHVRRWWCCVRYNAAAFDDPR
ncbi:MAG TPA: YraN family protein [Phycisphaerales bacterium]|nr:YraN family protein [Phycisphaerales bacterium]